MDVTEIERKPEGTEGEDYRNVFPPEEEERIYLYPLFKPAEVIRVPKGIGEHGGGDEMIQMAFFRGLEGDPLKLGLPVHIKDLLGSHAGK